MKRLMCTVLGLAVLGVAGCDQGSAVAPSTDPSRPEARRALTVTSPGDQTITQDQTDEMTIRINRDRFDGPVAVDLQNLPSGVNIVTEDKTIKAGDNTITLTIKADATAAAVENHRVTVVAKAKDQTDLPEAKVDFNLTVKNK